MILHTNIKGGATATTQYVSGALAILAADGIAVRHVPIGISGAYVWNEDATKLVHYTNEDAPDGVQHTRKITGYYTRILKRLPGVRIIQAFPNAQASSPTAGADERAECIPYPPARAAYLDALSAQPDFQNKPLDIFTSWGSSGYGGWRQAIAEQFNAHRWGGRHALMTFRHDGSKPGGQPIETYHGKPASDRMRWIGGKPHSKTVYQAYLREKLSAARVGWDSLGYHGAPYTHRFVECAWAGVCVIRSGPTGWPYRPGRDYLVEPDPSRAFELALYLLESGAWQGYATEVRRTYMNENTTEAFARRLRQMVAPEGA